MWQESSPTHWDNITKNGEGVAYKHREASEAEWEHRRDRLIKTTLLPVPCFSLPSHPRLWSQILKMQSPV